MVRRCEDTQFSSDECSTCWRSNNFQAFFFLIFLLNRGLSHINIEALWHWGSGQIWISSEINSGTKRWSENLKWYFSAFWHVTYFGVFTAALWFLSRSRSFKQILALKEDLLICSLKWLFALPSPTWRRAVDKRFRGLQELLYFHCDIVRKHHFLSFPLGEGTHCSHKTRLNLKDPAGQQSAWKHSCRGQRQMTIHCIQKRLRAQRRDSTVKTWIGHGTQRVPKVVTVSTAVAVCWSMLALLIIICIA